jgi:predicted patatin/cPLA2 family phospholipase
VYASTCIPILTEGQVIDGDLYFDGGVVDHIGAPFLLSNYHCERIISVYSRPKDNIDAVKNVTKEVAESYKNEDFKLKGVFSIVERTFEMMMRNTSINDEQISDAICQEKGIENIKILMPYSLMTETYKFDPDLNRSMCQIGKYAALNAVEDL